MYKASLNQRNRTDIERAEFCNKFIVNFCKCVDGIVIHLMSMLNATIGKGFGSACVNCFVTVVFARSSFL